MSLFCRHHYAPVVVRPSVAVSARYEYEAKDGRVLHECVKCDKRKLKKLA